MTLLSDEEIRHRMLADPELLERAKKTLKDMRDGEPADGDVVTAEELRDFLRKQG